MKDIKISLISLIAILLIVAAILLFIFYLAQVNSSLCISNPVEYANTHKDYYNWSFVVPMYIGG